MRTGRGLILAGGAVRGAFQAGVVHVLDRSGLRFDAIAAASVGAVNGAALLLGHGARLPDLWLENLSAVRWFEPRRLLRLRSPFLISQSMRLMVERHGGGAAGMARVREHPTELLISTTVWGTRRNVLFSSKDEAAGWTDEERLLQFLASLTIPLLCEEKIVIRGTRYCDGGISQNFPLAALVARGCRDVTVVDPSPGGIASLLMGRRPPAPPGVRVRWVAPGRPLGFRALDFTSLDAVRRALELGREAGERLVEELHLAEEPSISSANAR